MQAALADAAKSQGGTSTSSVPAGTPGYGAGSLPGGAPPVATSGATVLTVGVGKEFATLGAALAHATDGTVIEVDAGTYVNDFGTITSRVTIEGVGGIANFVATVAPPNLKGILTVDDDATIENCAFSGASIPDADGGNGAGIRYEGGQLVLVNDRFSGNEDGLLGAAVLPQLSANTITIDHSVFADNGSGSGYTHNLYVGAITALTVTNSVFAGAVVGHELKSRALANTLTNNVFVDGPTGTASYDIDLPNGGVDSLVGNVIEKGPDAQNDALIHFGGEGVPYAGSSLTVSGNALVNDLGQQAVGVLNQTATTATISGNTFVGFGTATVAQGPAKETGNVDGSGHPIADTTLSGVVPGSTAIFTDGAAHSVTLGSQLMAVEGGAGLLTAYAAGGHVIAVGGSGGMVFSESASSGGNQITTASGSTNRITIGGQDTLDSEGTDTIATGTGNVTGQIGGRATVSDGDAANRWTVNGTAAFTCHGGDPNLAIGTTGHATVGGTVDYLGLQTSGGSVAFDVTEAGTEISGSFAGGAVSATVTGNALSATTAAGGAGALITLGAGRAQVVSNGADLITAGSGADTIIVSGAARVHAGSGQLSVYGRGDLAGAVVYGAGGADLLSGDTGNITYVGAARAGTLALQLSNCTVQGGAGHLTINGGARETIAGGTGGITFADANGGANVVTTASGASDVLQLGDADVVDSWGQDLISGGTGNQVLTVHGNAVVTGSTGNSTVTLSGRDFYRGVGQDQVTVTKGAVATLSAGRAMAVSETGAEVVLGGGGGQASADVQGGAATLSTTATGLAITTGAGAATRVALAGGVDTVRLEGNDTIAAGSAGGSIAVSSGNAVIYGGTGAMSVVDTDANASDRISFFGGSGSASISGGAGGLSVVAGSGNVSLTGGTGAVTFTAGNGRASLALGSGGGQVHLGHGTTTVSIAGGSAAALFDVRAGQGGGSAVISGFRQGVDQIAGVSSKAMAAALHSPATATGGGTHLVLADGTRITLLGVANV